MPTIKWITLQGTLTATPLSERLPVTPINLEWASVINATWLGGPTQFISVATENIVIQPGLVVTGNNIAANTFVVSFDSSTSILELSNPTLNSAATEAELYVYGSVFGPTSVSIISGKVPTGLRLFNGAIIGTPVEVRTTVESRFVARISNGIDTIDRTFKLTVIGSNSPEWATESGLLPVGTNSRYFVLDNDRVDFNLTAIDQDIPAGDTVSYYIPNDGGELPPGLRLTSAGRIFGFTDPIFALQFNTGNGFYDGNLYDIIPYDIGERPKNGYDTFEYDTRIFDYSEEAITPSRINRYYQFVVAATDGINEVRRTFSIYVVTEDFLRSDNDILRVANGLFRADNTSTASPIWITESYLGRKRANNYLTLYLDVYDPPSLGGTISYSLLGINTITSGTVFGRTDAGENSIFIDLALDDNGNYVRPVVGQKICLADRNTFQSAYTITNLQNIDANRFRLDIGGVNATAIATWQSGELKSIVITNSGTGYLTQPVVVIQGGGANATGAAATAVVKNGRIVSVNITNRGTGFTEDPIITFGTVPNTIYNNSKVLIGSPSDLPPGMLLDTIIGEVTGTVPYQPRITQNYEFTLRATTVASNLVDSAFSDKTFNIDLIGEIESGVEWLTDTMLDPINPNMVSMLSVKAASKLTGGFINFSLVTKNLNGTDSILPPGITLLSTGDLVGKARQYEQDNLPGLTTFNTRPPVSLADAGGAAVIVDPNNLELDGGNLSVPFDLIIDGGSADSVYQLVGVSVPPTMFDGDTTTFDKTFTFTVRASDVFNFAQLDRTFTITITDEDPTVYSNLYVKAFQKKANRNMWYEFITNSAIFEPQRMYRYNDEHFGVQSELKMLLYAGIESVEAVEFVQAMSRNHYRKKLRFGNVKKAVAKNPVTQEIMYEVVYVEMVDNLESNGVSISSSVQLPANINSPLLVSYDNIKVDSDIPFASDRDHQRVFPNSVKNMRNRIKTLGKREREFLPLWMRSIQPDSFVETGFVKAVPLCYTTLNNADYIIANIKARLNAEVKEERFDFKMLDFEIDRYVIDSVGGYIQDKYLVFPQRDSLNKSSDSILDTVPLTTGVLFDREDIFFDSEDITFE